MSAVGDVAVQLIKPYESCQLSPYADEKGVPTIGWGNTYYQDKSKVTLEDQPLTQDEADSLLEFWLETFVTDVSIMCQGKGTVNQLAAFTSLAYNIGDGNFLSSTALRQFLADNLAYVGPAIVLWNQSGGKVLKGLQRRREAERLVFYGLDPISAIAQALEAYP